MKASRKVTTTKSKIEEQFAAAENYTDAMFANNKPSLDDIELGKAMMAHVDGMRSPHKEKALVHFLLSHVQMMKAA